MTTDVLAIAAESREYILIPTSITAGGEAVDPVAGDYTPYIAFTTVDTRPGAGDWNTASWEQAGGGWHAMCLVGPGGTVELPAGVYDPWVKVTGPTPEVPVKQAPGRVEVS